MCWPQVHQAVVPAEPHGLDVLRGYGFAIFEGLLAYEAWHVVLLGQLDHYSTVALVFGVVTSLAGVASLAFVGFSAVDAFGASLPRWLATVGTWLSEHRQD